MNNCHRDYGVRNAREIAELLGVIGKGKGSRVKGEAEGQGTLL